MLAIHAPAAIALITPARRDSPRPAGMVRSASGPRPNTSLLPSGMPTTSPDGVVTRAAAGLPGWCAMALLSARMPMGAGSASLGLGDDRRIPESGDSLRARGTVGYRKPGARHRHGPLEGLPVTRKAGPPGHGSQRGQGAHTGARSLRASFGGKPAASSSASPRALSARHPSPALAPLPGRLSLPYTRPGRAPR